MNILDWVIVAYLAFGFLNGWRRGFLSLAISIAGYVVAYILATHYYLPVAHFFETKVVPTFLSGGSPITQTVKPFVFDAIAFLVVILAVELVVGIVASVFRGANRLPLLGGMNRLFGAILGLGENLAIASIVIFVLSPLLGGSLGPFGQLLNHSQLYSHLLKNWAPPFAVP